MTIANQIYLVVKGSEVLFPCPMKYTKRTGETYDIQHRTYTRIDCSGRVEFYITDPHEEKITPLIVAGLYLEDTTGVKVKIATIDEAEESVPPQFTLAMKSIRQYHELERS
ncbi:hypothetical protein [Tunturiibacter psychrotolerans]|uniref:hypothetical protein n=1 Tax=Tunturiibacter psychrotolerans TaxID=3069686 RepID=UPI003D1A9586